MMNENDGELNTEVTLYIDTNQALWKHIGEEDKMTRPFVSTGQVCHTIFIKESGTYSKLFCFQRAR